MLTLSLAERVDDATFYCYGSGYVRTNLMRDMPWWLRAFAATFGRVISISASQAADHIMQLLRGNYDSGLYGRNAKHNTPSDFKANPANRDKLWQMSETMLQQALDKPSV